MYIFINGLIMKKILMGSCVSIIWLTGCQDMQTFFSGNERNQYDDYNRQYVIKKYVIKKNDNKIASVDSEPMMTKNNNNNKARNSSKASLTVPEEVKNDKAQAIGVPLNAPAVGQ